jgi:hypothetical protein
VIEPLEESLLFLTLLINMEEKLQAIKQPANTLVELANISRAISKIIPIQIKLKET